MSRRPVNASRRVLDSENLPLPGFSPPKSRTSPLIALGLLFVVVVFVIGYSYIKPDGFGGEMKMAIPTNDEGLSCTAELQRAIPFLKKAYGNSMHKVLHVGPDTCLIVSNLLKEGDIEAWGIEPYELEDVDNSCKILVRKGIVRVSDIKFPLPYKPRSFSLVIVSDALDYLSPKYLNKTLPDLARVSKHGLVIFAGYPGQPKAKSSEPSKFGKPAKLRSSSWWIRYFVQTRLEENESAATKFAKAENRRSYKPSCQVFHLSSNRFPGCTRTRTSDGWIPVSLPAELRILLLLLTCNSADVNFLIQLSGISH